MSVAAGAPPFGATQLKACPPVGTTPALLSTWAACRADVTVAVAVVVAAILGTGRRTLALGLGHLTDIGGSSVWATFESCRR